MAYIRSFTGFLTSDLVGTQNMANGQTFDVAAIPALNVLFQDLDARAEGDPSGEVSNDPEGDQIAFISDSTGTALIDGSEFYLELSFEFTVGGQTYTGYQFEIEGTGEDFVILPPGVPAGTATVTSVNFNPSPDSVRYDALTSGDEDIDQADFTNLDTSGDDYITSGSGDDTVLAGGGNDIVNAGAGDDTVFGQGGADIIHGDGLDMDEGQRLSFNWSQLPDPTPGGGLVDDGDDIAAGVTQDTGGIIVDFTYTNDGNGSGMTFESSTGQNTSGFDTGSETVNSNSAGRMLGSGGVGDTATIAIDFSASNPAWADEVQNVDFRINDIDISSWQDIITIRAFDADGNPVAVILTPGADMTASDTDGIAGNDTVIADTGTGNGSSPDADKSLLVEIPGPVGRIEIDYGNLDAGGQLIDVTDIYFDAGPEAIGNDTLDGGGGADRIFGGGGNDAILGAGGADFLYGQEGQDTITGGAGNDTMYGGDDRDTFNVEDGHGTDTITGGEGGDDLDTVVYSSTVSTQGVNVVFTADEDANYNFFGTTGSGTFTEIEAIVATDYDDTLDATVTTAGISLDGGAGGDTITGGSGNDTLIGGTGNDTLAGLEGADTLDGGAGMDFADYSASDAAVTVDLSANTASGGHATGDTISGIDGIIGSDFDDVMTGYDGEGTPGPDYFTNVFYGGGGNDQMSGNGGADEIYGQTGDDVIDGGAGGDTLDGGTGADTITGGTGDDTMDGGADRDLFAIDDGDGTDAITGGEAGDDLDTVDFDATTSAQGVTVTYTGDEAATYDYDGTTSGGTFTEIEALDLTEFDDTVDATASAAAVTLDGQGGADDLTGGTGGDTIDGGTGNDTITGGLGDDTLDGGADQDLFNINDTDGTDTITGGEAGSDLDTVDFESPSSSQGVTVNYTGDEAGTYDFDGTTAGGDFTEIEALDLTNFNDTVNAAASTAAVTLNGQGGNDALTGGTGGDTIDGGTGDDTITGGLGNDTLDGGADRDLFNIDDTHGTDTITGGEAGDDFDTVDFDASTSGQGVTVTYTGDEAATYDYDGTTSGGSFSEIEAIDLTANDDTVDASASSVAVPLDGQGGNDTLTGGSGNDTILGGTGNDTIAGGAGDDTLTGGGDRDTFNITDTDGTDTITGGETGDDVDRLNLTSGGPDGVTVTYTGSEAGTYDYDGTTGGGTFTEIEELGLTDYDDTVDASASTTAVTLDGGDGDDTLTGGAGADTLLGGDGNDTITLGDGDTAGGGADADIFVVGADPGTSATISDFDPTTGVTAGDPIDQTDNDFVDLSAFFSSIADLRAAVTSPPGDDIVLDLGGGQTLTFTGVTDPNALNFENVNVVCFARGTMIRTEDGANLVEDLAIGDRVETMDNGAQEIRWIGSRVLCRDTLRGAAHLNPVRIRKGTFGNIRDLVVSPQHRILVRGTRTEMMFGAPEVFVKAKDLIDGVNVIQETPDEVEYFHILFDDHEIVFAEGAAAESLHPGCQALKGMTHAMRAEVIELFPELSALDQDRPLARMPLKSHEAQALFRRSA